MITISMMAIPGGIGFMRFDVLSGSICTTDCGKFHAYRIWFHGRTDDVDDVLHSGVVPKVRSGHRNPFHLLGDICDDIVKRQDNAILAQIDGD